MRGATPAVANRDAVGYVIAVTSERPVSTRTLSAPVCYALLAALALVLFFPGLGSFGFWDPYEVKIADAARNVATAHRPRWRRRRTRVGRPPATVALVAYGFKLFGVGELGGRLPDRRHVAVAPCSPASTPARG